MEYNGKKALVCGMARSGIAAAKLLNRLGARVTLQDMKKREEISADVLALEGEGIVLYTGANPDEIACAQDLIVLSPGIPCDLPFIAAAENAGIEVISEVELAYRLTPCPITAITGTNGKTTTTTLTRRNHENGLQRHGGCRKHWGALQRGGRAADRKGLGGCGNQQLSDGKGEGISSAYQRSAEYYTRPLEQT